MASVPTDPSVGLNAETGGTLTGWEHVLQSLENVFTTSFGDRIAREWYGSFVPAMLGRANINRQEAPLFMTALATAIMQWEPRFHVTAIQLSEAGRDGALSILIEGEYRPRATYGDDRAEGGSRRLSVSYAASSASPGWAIREV